MRTLFQNSTGRGSEAIVHVLLPGGHGERLPVSLTSLKRRGPGGKQSMEIEKGLTTTRGAYITIKRRPAGERDGPIEVRLTQLTKLAATLKGNRMRSGHRNG